MGSPANVDLPTELARRLKAARALSGKKVRDLARELGWSDEKVYRLESGKQVPDALELSAIAAATNQSVDYFFGDTSPRSEDAVLTRDAGASQAGTA